MICSQVRVGSIFPRLHLEVALDDPELAPAPIVVAGHLGEPLAATRDPSQVDVVVVEVITRRLEGVERVGANPPVALRLQRKLLGDEPLEGAQRFGRAGRLGLERRPRTRIQSRRELRHLALDDDEDAVDGRLAELGPAGDVLTQLRAPVGDAGAQQRQQRPEFRRARGWGPRVGFEAEVDGIHAQVLARILPPTRHLSSPQQVRLEDAAKEARVDALVERQLRRIDGVELTEQPLLHGEPCVA